MKRIEIYAVIAGVVLLVSGVAKAVDVSVFAQTIAHYGFENLQFVAPLIVLAEISLGLLLVFQMWQKKTAFFAAIVIVCFTIIYAYGLIFKGVEDCGCFGTIAALNTSPVVTFSRNAALLYLLVAAWRKGENKSNCTTWTIVTMAIVLVIVAFMLGYTFRTVEKTRKTETYKAQAIENTGLKEFITTSKDSTYLVFVFSYNCPHCLNSIANLKEYEQAGIVDKVIALALGDSITGKKFTKMFKPNFTIKNHSEELLQLTKNFPKAYYIRNDSVVKEVTGELPCAYLFKGTSN